MDKNYSKYSNVNKGDKVIVTARHTNPGTTGVIKEKMITEDNMVLFIVDIGDFQLVLNRDEFELCNAEYSVMPNITEIAGPAKLTREEWKDLEKKLEPKLHHGDYTLELLDKILALPEGDSERQYYDSEGLTASSIVSITHVRENVFMVFWRC